MARNRSNKVKSFLAKCLKSSLFVSAWTLILVFPIFIVLSYFPLWVQSTAKTVSGLSVIMIAIVMLVGWKLIKPRINPNISFLFWLFLFYGISIVVLLSIKAIIADITSALFLSACSTVIGTILYILWEALKEDDDEKDGEVK